MAGTGQLAWNHACDWCAQYVVGDNGKLVAVYWSVMTDGVSLGHPCCAVHDCKIPLTTNKHHYCPIHSSLSNLCVVVSCQALAMEGFKTCGDPQHWATEDRFTEWGKAMFLLKKRLVKVQQYPASNLFQPQVGSDGGRLREDNELQGLSLGNSEGEGDEVQVNEGGEVVEQESPAHLCTRGCGDNKAPGGHSKVFAHFGCRHTHNEELFVASCGIILGQATFYGAGGPNSVRVSSHSGHCLTCFLG